MTLFKRKQIQNKVLVKAPIDGEYLALEHVPDPVFSQKMMGDGIAIVGCGEIVSAPIDGILTLVAETKHAFGILDDNGIELMVHVGLDTVQLKGTGFTVLAKLGEHVKQGTPILKLDLNYLLTQKVNLITPIIVLNSQEHPLTHMETPSQVRAGIDGIFEII